MPSPLSMAHLAGLAAFQGALLLAFVAPRWTFLPLALFALACAVAPFLPTVGFFLPLRAHGKRNRSEVALSFDDGPDPAVTPQVLEVLKRTGVKAVFFLVGTKAEAHPDLVRAILADGHEVGSHSWRHDPLLMLKGRRRMEEEVGRAQEIFARFGIQPRAFRPPVGITAPPLWPVLLAHGMCCVNFSCRAWDRGNRAIRHLAARLLHKVRPGDLILLHDVAPPKASPQVFLAELGQLLEGLRQRGLEVVPPSQLLGCALMAHQEKVPGLAASFYDDLAASYDQEQFETAVSLSRTLELKRFRERLPDLARAGGKALELGAGTGIFTLDLARHCEDVHAVDVSANMLRILAQKAQAQGLGNIRLDVGDAETMEFQGPYHLVCSFLSFEYFQDLPAFFLRLQPHLAPGARLYFITARRSLFRFFTQIGNALRQGLWLRARSRREVRRMLRAAGLEPIRMEGHLLKGWGFGGMLLEVEGQVRDTGPSRG